MTRDEWDDLWTTALLVWPGGRLDIAVGDAWWNHVNHLPAAATEAAFNSLARHNTYPPALADLVKSTQDVIRTNQQNAARRGLQSGDRLATYQTWIDAGCPTTGRDDEDRITTGTDAHHLYLGAAGKPVDVAMALTTRTEISRAEESS